MKITREEIQKVASLARLQLSESEIERMTEQLGTILSYVKKLDEVDTEGVPVTTHTQQVVNAFREDVAKPSLERDAVLRNAPEDNGESFTVPRIIS